MLSPVAAPAEVTVIVESATAPEREDEAPLLREDGGAARAGRRQAIRVGANDIVVLALGRLERPSVTMHPIRNCGRRGLTDPSAMRSCLASLTDRTNSRFVHIRLSGTRAEFTR